MNVHFIMLQIDMVSCDGDSKAIRRCLTAGFFANSAVYHPTGVYRTVRDSVELAIHPSSVLYTETPAPCILFGDVVQATSKRHLMRDVTVIESSWLYELAPHYYEYGTENELASKRSRFE
jgi:ATP-dependent RNA helicase DDX35